MKERPVLFSAPMVLAILDDHKTKTRRMVNPQPKWCYEGNNIRKCHVFQHDNGVFSLTAGWGAAEEHRSLGKCPYGQPGDRLWVRETHYAYGRWALDGKTKRGNPHWRFQRASNVGIQFEAPAEGFRKSRDKDHPGFGCWYQRRARFMPKSATRIWLEITSVRVERLQDISEADARKEGCIQGEKWDNGDGYFPAEIDAWDGVGKMGWECARDWFADLWDYINGEYAFARNPWVWVVEFRRVTP